MSQDKTQFPCAEKDIPHYTAYRLKEPIRVDGVLNETSWQAAPRSSRFVDLISGQPTLHDTRAALLWDDKDLYVGYWVEEPNVAATLTERDSPIYKNNDVEFFVAGKDSYYEFEINAFNTIYEVFFIWEQAYDKGGFASVPEFSRTNRRSGCSMVSVSKRIRAEDAWAPGLGISQGCRLQFTSMELSTKARIKTAAGPLSWHFPGRE